MQQPFDLDFGDAVKPSLVPMDDAVEEVAWWLGGFEDFEETMGRALRKAIDEVLDGQRTGRYSMDQLDKTEKTYLGTKVEIVVRAALELPRGRRMDYLIAGHEVDAKFSVSRWGWTIPREAMGEICLLIHADDAESRFTVGLLRITDSVLNSGSNQDGKRGISAKYGRPRIRWLITDGTLPRNELLHMDAVVRDRILRAGSGQLRIDMLFREVHGRVVNRETVSTVGAQMDVAKRVRDSRSRLASEGIIILGYQKIHGAIATALGLPVPRASEWVAVRLVADRDDGRPAVVLAGRPFVTALPTEPEEPVPTGY